MYKVSITKDRLTIDLEAETYKELLEQMAKIEYLFRGLE